MGRYQATITVSTSLSRHNSEQDEKDDAAFEALTAKIAELCADPQFEDISAQVMDAG